MLPPSAAATMLPPSAEDARDVHAAGETEEVEQLTPPFVE
jgi:hypothetical protein